MLALTVALVAPYFVDWTPYRANFEREASRILGREVTVEGTASARLLPFPSVTFTDVVVAGSVPGEPAMTVETFSMDAELAPFMRGEIYIFDMRLIRPSVLVDVGEDGSLDWAARPSVPIGADHIALEKVTVTEGKVTVRHAESGRDHTLSEVNAEMSARALIGPWRMEGSMRVDGMRTAVSLTTGTLAADGGIRVRLRARPDRYAAVLETDGNARIEDGRATYSGQFRLNATAASERLRTGEGDTFPLADGGSAQQRNAAPLQRLSGSFSFDHSALTVDAFRYEAGSADDPYTADGSAEFRLGAEPSFLVRADGAQVRFEDATGEDGSGIRIEERLASAREFLLDVPKPTIPGRVELMLPAIVAGDTTVRDVHLFAEPSDAGWRIASAGATLPGRTTLEAAGELAVGDALAFEGSLLLAVGQPSGFAAWLAKDVDDAIRRLPAAGFSADVSLSEERQSFRDLELMLGSATFRGEIDSQTPSNARSTATLKLDGERLDVEGMAAFASLFVSDDGQTRMGERDLSFEITAGPVSAAGLTAEAIDTALRLRGGTLEIDKLSVEGLAGANISATGSLKELGGTPTGDIDATIISADLAPLLAMLADRYPHSRFVSAAMARSDNYPGLLEDASIHVVAGIAQNENGSGGLAFSATGNAGGTEFSLTGSAPELGLAPEAARLTLDLAARNDEAATLYALFGLPALPLGLAGGADAELTIDGVIAEGAKTRLVFSGEGLSVVYDGEAALNERGFSATGAARLEADDLEPWLAAAIVSLPGAGYGLPVKLAAELDLDDGLMVLSGLRGEVAGSALEGDVNAQLRDGLPHLTGALALKAFDLGPLAELVTGTPALMGDGERWPNTPFAQNVSPLVTSDVELTVERLGFGTFGEVADAKLTLRLSPETVSLSNLEAHAFDGELSGIIDFSNDTGTGLLSAQLKLANANVAGLLGDVGVSGRADLTASTSASGKSLDGLVSALAGSGTARVRDLAIQHLDPGAFPALLTLADLAGPDIDSAATAVFAPPALRSGPFLAESADIAFTIASGRLRAPPVRLVQPEATLSAELRADLSERTVGADATLAFEPGVEALVGSEPAVRFAVAGPLDDLGIHVDTEPLAQFLTQRALELEQQRVEAMQATLLEGQRHRREVRYYAALAEERRRDAEQALRAAEEADRFDRELERSRREAERLMREEDARRAAEEEAQRAAEEEARQAAEEEARLVAEEEARQAAEEEARRAAEAEEEARRAAEEAEEAARASERETQRPVDDEMRLEGFEDTVPEPRARETPPAQATGSSAFSEENLSVDGLMRAIGEMP